MSAMMSGRATDPNPSRCALGFKVRRPASFAVGSPHLSAAQPWATSCTVADNITSTTDIAMLMS